MTFVGRLLDASGAEIYGGLRTSPAVFDVDGDGDPDLVLGDESGALAYYENSGGRGPFRFAYAGDLAARPPRQARVPRRRRRADARRRRRRGRARGLRGPAQARLDARADADAARHDDDDDDDRAGRRPHERRLRLRLPLIHPEASLPPSKHRRRRVRASFVRRSRLVERTARAPTVASSPDEKSDADLGPALERVLPDKVEE